MAIYQGLVDYLGRPIEKRLLGTEIAAASTMSVRTPIAGYPADGLTPPRLSAILKEADQGYPLRFYELAETVEERDMHYAAVLGTRKRSVAQIDISVAPAGEDTRSLELAKLIEDWLKRDELGDELFDILDAIGKGQSFTEIMWDTSEGQWRPKRLERADQRFFRPSRIDLKTPMLIDDNGEDTPLPAFKFIDLVARGKSGLPARSGLARLATWFWLFKSMTVRDWAIYTATYGQPIRVGKYGAGATEGDKDTLFRAVANIAGDCAAIIPDSMLIEFVQPPTGTSSGGALYEDRADWLDRQMSKATLGQTTTTDAVSGGHAVSQEHRQVQEDIERADAKVLSAALNRDLVRPWIDLEYGPQKLYPRIVIGRPDEEDLQQLTDAVSKLVPVGLKVSAKEIRGKLGLSEPQKGEELLEAAKPAPVMIPGPDGLPGPAVDQPAARPTLHAVDPGESEADRQQRAIDALADETGVLAGPSMDAVLDLIHSIVLHANSLEEVRSTLLGLAPQISTDKLAGALRQAQLVARLSGRATLADV